MAPHMAEDSRTNEELPYVFIGFPKRIPGSVFKTKNMISNSEMVLLIQMIVSENTLGLVRPGSQNSSS